jgi:hypothetical protein
MKKTIAALILLTFSSLSQALSYSQQGGTFNMSGEIKKGDFHSFVKAFASWDAAPRVFHITSGGGNLDEAMKIGDFIATSNIPVWVWNECNSACVFIYASGVKRDVRGKIGLHRPYFSGEYFSSLTSLEAEKKYNELKLRASFFLKKVGVSQDLITRMFSTSSKNIDYISAENANKQFGTTSDFYEEWLIAKCGEPTLSEQKIITSIGYLDAARMGILALDDPDIPKSNDFEDNLRDSMDKGRLALTLDRNDMLQPYRNLSERHYTCTSKASDSHINGFHLTIKNNLDKVLRGFDKIYN